MKIVKKLPLQRHCVELYSLVCNTVTLIRNNDVQLQCYILLFNNGNHHDSDTSKNRTFKSRHFNITTIRDSYRNRRKHIQSPLNIIVLPQIVSF